MSPERIKHLRANVEMLKPLAAHDPDHWGEPLAFAIERLDRAASAMLDNFHRDVFAARTRHQLQQETHVIVGDDQPERRLV